MLNLRNDTQTGEILGIVFILVAILGFFPNPLVSPTGLFAVNPVHNMVHAILGGALALAAARGHGKQALLAVGIVYILVAILGYATMTDMMLGIVRVNMADHYLHLLLGLVLIGAGLYVKPAK